MIIEIYKISDNCLNNGCRLGKKTHIKLRKKHADI